VATAPHRPVRPGHRGSGSRLALGSRVHSPDLKAVLRNTSTNKASPPRSKQEFAVPAMRSPWTEHQLHQVMSTRCPTLHSQQSTAVKLNESTDRNCYARQPD
jgi:hypothetical protein